MICSTCKTAEAEPGQRVCSKCRNAYMRSYRRTVVIRSVRQAKRDGAECFRDKVVRMFRGMGDREMNGLTAALIVEDMFV